MTRKFNLLFQELFDRTIKPPQLGGSMKTGSSMGNDMDDEDDMDVKDFDGDVNSEEMIGQAFSSMMSDTQNAQNPNAPDIKTVNKILKGNNKLKPNQKRQVLLNLMKNMDQQGF